MKELSLTAASYLLLGFFGATGLLFALASMRKDRQVNCPARGVFWCLVAIMCLGVIVFFADSLESLKALERISHRVEAIIRGL